MIAKNAKSHFQVHAGRSTPERRLAVGLPRKDRNDDPKSKAD
jgi:hypothetical protein